MTATTSTTGRMPAACRWCTSRSMPAKISIFTSSSADGSRPFASGACSFSAAATWFTTFARSTGPKKEIGFDWAQRFDEAARTTMTERPSEAAALRRHADYERAAPTPEHFVPLLHLAGLAAAAEQKAQLLVHGYAFGSLSMTSYTFEARCPPGGDDPRPAAGLARTPATPAEDMNV